jgi:hypothetical protein
MMRLKTTYSELFCTENNPSNFNLENGGGDLITASVAVYESDRQGP